MNSVAGYNLWGDARTYKEAVRKAKVLKKDGTKVMIQPIKEWKEFDAMAEVDLELV